MNINPELSGLEALRLWRLAGLPRDTMQYKKLKWKAEREKYALRRAENSRAWRTKNPDRAKALGKDWKKKHAKRWRKYRNRYNKLRVRLCVVCGKKGGPGWTGIINGACGKCRKAAGIPVFMTKEQRRSWKLLARESFSAGLAPHVSKSASS